MITKGSIEHWDKIKSIYIQGILTKKATFETVEQIGGYDNWAKSKIKDSLFIKMINSEIVGWAGLSKVSERCVYGGVGEVSVYVAPEAQGQGVGTELMQKLIDFAEANNIWTLQAGIFAENEASIHLHEKFGFRKVGIREKLGQLDGEWKDVVLLEKRSKTIL